MLRWTLNTVLYAVLGHARPRWCPACPVAYALAKMRWRGRKAAFIVVIIAMMLPPQVTAVPLYLMWAKLGTWPARCGR